MDFGHSNNPKKQLKRKANPKKKQKWKANPKKKVEQQGQEEGQGGGQDR